MDFLVGYNIGKELSVKSTNESSLTNSIKKDFTNINNTNTDNSTSIKQNQTINKQKNNNFKKN